LAVAGQRSGAGWILRAVTTVLVAGAVVAPVLTVATWSADDIGDDLAFVESERRGVRYLQPLSRLLGELVRAQGAAVRGETVDTAKLQAELSAVERAEDDLSTELRSRARWTNVRDAVRELSERPGAPGLEALQRWSQAVDLTIGLARRVGDTSSLILDPELDSYYLMDAALLRLPEIIQGAGQLSDLLALTPVNRTPLDDLRAAVMRDRIATAAAAVNSGLGKVVDVTGSRRVSSALLEPLDQFGAAVDALAPSVAVGTMPPLPQNVAAAAVGVRESAQRLAQTAWSELDALLAGRGEALSERRVYVALGAAAGVLVGALVAVLLWRRRRPRAADGPDGHHGATRYPTGPDYPAHHTGGSGGRGGSARPGGDPAVNAISGSPRAPAGAR